MQTTGFFVDWAGNTRRFESPGDGMTCRKVPRVHAERQWDSVEVADSAGFVMHEATFFHTLADVEAAGVTINLVD